MSLRKIVRIPFLAALLIALIAAPTRSVDAQSRTGGVVACLDAAANDLVSCVDDLPWYAEALCYARYASDAILCLPAILVS